jgi:eukaryotic-like serine/threonine-protein kinase
LGCGEDTAFDWLLEKKKAARIAAPQMALDPRDRRVDNRASPTRAKEPTMSGSNRQPETLGPASQECGRRFAEACRAAGNGDPFPLIETYLEGVPEAERPALRRKLERILERCRAGLGQTVDYASHAGPPATLGPGAAAQVTAAGGADADPQTAGTVEHVETPEPAAPTLDDVRRPGKDGKRPAPPGYDMLGVLGRGGMGVVYKARQVKLNRTVALKMVLAGAHASPDQLARFNTEAHAVARLQHPNIVQIYEVGEQDGLPYFSLEFVDGGPLDKKIAGKPQPPREAAQVVETLARAMAFAHQRHIIHRDLKPGNVLLTADGVPKITDFGLAKAVEEDSGATRSGTILGTPSYMAPEQAWGKVHEIGPLADQYALGAVLYDLLTGRPPFHGASLLETLEQVRTREPVPPSQLQPTVPADLETVCLKCLQKEPHKRYADCQALADDLRRFLGGEPIRARPVGNAERFVRWCRRNPKLASLTIAVFTLLVAMVAGSTGFALRLKREKDQAELLRQEADRAAEAEKNARAVADQEKLKAQKAQKLAEDNEQAADEQGNLLVQTLNEQATTIQDGLKGKPGMAALQKALLDQTMKGLEGALQKSRESELGLRTKAIIHQRYGDILGRVGRPAAALEQYKQALAATERRFRDARPDDPIAVYNLYTILTRMGDVTQALDDPVAARGYYLDALRLARKGADLAAQPAKVRFNLRDVAGREVSNLNGRLGAVSLAIGQPREAKQFYDESLRWRKQSKPARGKEIDARREQISHLEKEGELSFRLGDSQTGVQKHREALAQRRKFSAEHPDNVDLQRDLSHTLLALGDMILYARGDPAEALRVYQETLAIREPLLAQDPDNAYAMRDVGASAYRMGVASARLGRPADAHFRQALQLRQRVVDLDPKSVPNRITLLLTLAHCGRAAEAAAAAAEVRRQAPENPATLFSVACVYAQCLGASRGDSARAEAYRRLTLEVLRQAIRFGWSDPVLLRASPDLDPVQEDAEFRRMVGELGPK